VLRILPKEIYAFNATIAYSIKLRAKGICISTDSPPIFTILAPMVQET
jgi:hypothetical protein